MRILLVYPNSPRELIGWGDLGAIAEPLALEYIAGVAIARGHDVKLLDLRLHPHELELQLYAYKPHIVGVTGYSMHVLRNLEICSQVRRILPTCKIIVGGHHATLLPEDFFEPCVDYVVVGEGTQPFTQILTSLEEGMPAGAIAGVWSRAGVEFIYGGPPRHFEIDQIPAPDRSVTAEDRDNYFIDWMKPIALIRTSVGCPYRCSFCALWKIMDGRYYKRDVLRVINELKSIQERYVFLVDDEPFVNPSRMWELADYIEEFDVEKEFFSYCRIDSFLRDRSLMERWHAIGLRRVFFGVETVFQDELDDYNKRQQRKDIILALDAARSIGIKVFTNFIIKPTYQPHHFEEIVRFIRTHDVEYPSFTILTPIPGTEASATFDHIIEKQPNGRPNWSLFDLQNPVTATTLPKAEFMQEYHNLHHVFAQNYLVAEHPFYVNMQQASQKEEERTNARRRPNQ